MNAVRSRMTHRCLIERNTPSETNPDGHPGPPDWGTHIADQPCFLYTRRTGGETVSADRTVTIEAMALMLPLGVDVTRDDRINGVTDRQGAAVLTGKKNIRDVEPRHTHLEVLFEGAL